MLRRTSTTNIVPVVLVVVVGIQAAIVVVQVVLIVAIVRSSRPPVAVRSSIVERAIVPVAAVNRPNTMQLLFYFVCRVEVCDFAVPKLVLWKMLEPQHTILALVLVLAANQQLDT